MASQRPQDRPERPVQSPGPKGPIRTAPARPDGVERDLTSNDDEYDPITRRNGQRETDRGRWGARGAVARRSLGGGAYDDEDEAY